MSQLAALIFDVDGTLAETERDGHRVAFNRAFAEAGLDWHWSIAQYGKLLDVTGGKERLQFYRKTRCPDFLPDDIPAWAAELHRLKTRHYKELLQTGIIPLRPGVRRLLEAARSANVRLAIATTTTLENVTTLLETALAPGSAAWFDLIAAGDIVPHKKPAPDVYHYVLKKLSLPPEVCLAIEDSHQGLQSATQAGLTTVITVNDYTCKQDFTQAAIVLDHLGEPNQPFRILAGDFPAATYFDLSLAEQLLTTNAKLGEKPGFWTQP
jgi:HAD superfamily hydrolase (TIGR01509 family)